MFQKKDAIDKNDINPEIVNRITTGTVIKGDIITSNNIRIDGKLEGNLDTKSKLIIGTTGEIIGEVVCQSADISGEIKGKIKVAELIQLKASAKITGEIITSKLSIEPGAQFTGNCNMGAVVKDINIGKSESKEKTA